MLSNTSIVSRLMALRDEIDALIDSAGGLAPRNVDMETVVSAVAVQTGVSIDQMKGRQRTDDVVRARRLAMKLIHDTGRYSYPQIGRFFGRDHTTVMIAIKKSKGRQP